MLKTIQAILSKYKGQKIAIGASGGVDSMTLCSLVLSCGLFDDITLLHINHNLRMTAKRDCDLVKNFALDNNLKFESISIDIEGLAKKNKNSIETEARNVRYKFFSEFVAKNDALLLLGHTQDDNIESILMHIFRGCGLHGLVGMSVESDYPVNLIRPLINTPKIMLYEYAKTHNIKYYEDETNLDTKYSRNLIRKIVGEVSEVYNGVSGNILKLSDIAKKAAKALENKLDEDYFTKKDGAVVLDKKVMGTGVSEYYIIEAFKRAGLKTGFEAKHIDAIKGLDNGKMLDLPSGFVVYSDKESFVFKKSMHNAECTMHNDCTQNDMRLLADADKLEGATLRFRREGDKFKKFGGGTKKLKDFFNEMGVPSRERDSVPLLVKDDKILVVIGYEIADEVKVTKDTKRVIKLWKE